MKLIRFALLVAHLLIIGMLLGSILNAFIPPSYSRFLNILSLGFPILLIGHILLTFLWIILWKKRAFVFIALSYFLYTPTRRWVNYTEASTKEANFSILSFNTNNASQGQEDIENFISEQNPDVFFLQESAFTKSHDFSFKGYPYKTGPLHTVIYSKHKILDQGNIINNAENNALAIYADIEVHATRLRFITFYLEPFMMDTEEKQMKNVDKTYINKLNKVFKKHETQVKLIQEAISSSPYPVIVGGDMNAVPNSYEYFSISSGLTDSFEAVGNGFGTTFNDTKIPIRIDYLFSSKNIVPVHYTIDRSERLSDHFPIIAKYQIP